MCELREFGLDPLIHDPLADPRAAGHEFGLALSPLDAFHDLDAVIYAVSHRAYAELGVAAIAAMVVPGGAIVDVKATLVPADLPPGVQYWSL